MIKEFDPVNVKVAQQERTARMRGGLAKNWEEVHSKLIDFEKRVLEYESRVDRELWIS